MSANNPGCLGAILKLFGVKFENKNLKEVAFPYAMRDDFLSPSELSFYKVLGQVIPKDLIICPKVSLKDIFFVTDKDRSNQSKYFNKISRKHVDFLLCSSETMQPVCGIELDDSSHARHDSNNGTDINFFLSII
ncbi:hypothetical protein BKP37_03705 [Anaerobacillus alkalilacustris]|uniref:DUF2726 domain-containing protein n=1 Tax=Anaerobacillus alkalilacustris TaxID=393763 RepID=A0A1S2LZF2_9BACI|nr:DUF2726 domain-containing protein [Anaerobacillus alkalilacustris]OIJ17603.1 hypothetical protein BKP37_03705 [Anaerobacillus alkalilacustris]